MKGLVREGHDSHAHMIWDYLVPMKGATLGSDLYLWKILDWGLTHEGRARGDTESHSWSYPTITGFIGKGWHSSPRAAKQRDTEHTQSPLYQFAKAHGYWPKTCQRTIMWCYTLQDFRLNQINVGVPLSKIDKRVMRSESAGYTISLTHGGCELLKVFEGQRSFGSELETRSMVKRILKNRLQLFQTFGDKFRG